MPKKQSSQVGHPIKHGHTCNGQYSRTYQSWRNMIQRCTNPKNKGFHRYGGRGIKVCLRWRNSFEDFLSDMSECPPKLEIERIDNKGNYEPGNCYWGTQHEQDRNKRSNHNVMVRGVTGCFLDVATHFGIKVNTVDGRLRRGWDLERAFTTPPDKRCWKRGLTSPCKERSVSQP